MANDLGDTLRQMAMKSLQDAIGGQQEQQKPKRGVLSGGKGLMAGAALAAVAPLAKRGVEAARSGELDDLLSKFGGSDDDAQDDGDGDEPEARESDDEPRDEEQSENEEREPSGGPTATGKGRRMPIQQAVDVGVPLETAYNQFTQFEDWPEFMHRATRVTQEDDCTISFATKIWGKTKEFTAKIETQKPDERIKWHVSQGITHHGVVTFHELAPRLTRIEVTLDIDPGSLIEKAARGMRHVKRAVRADLHRFKAFVEMQEVETGAWRGVIVDGELAEPHDDAYDEERDYSDIEDAKAEAEGDDDEQDEQDEPPEAEADDQGEDEDEDEDDVRPERLRRRARRRTPAPA